MFHCITYNFFILFQCSHHFLIFHIQPHIFQTFLLGEGTLTYPTAAARRAQIILARDNLFVEINETREKALFDSQEVGKGTLEQQKQTTEKNVEESSRTENQKEKDEAGRE